MVRERGGKFKQKRMRAISRKDEQLAREKGITQFMSVYDIINLPMEKFIEQLKEHKSQNGMTMEQQQTAKEIRIRGKNRNAAFKCHSAMMTICRKRDRITEQMANLLLD